MVGPEVIHSMIISSYLFSSSESEWVWGVQGQASKVTKPFELHVVVMQICHSPASLESAD